MIIDDFYLYLFIRLNRAVLENKEVTTGEMAKEFFPCSSEECRKKYGNDFNRFNTAKTNFIKKRLIMLEKDGVLKIIHCEKSKIKFVLDNEKILFQKHKFPSGYKEAILIKNRSGKWDVYEI